MRDELCGMSEYEFHYYRFHHILNFIKQNITHILICVKRRPLFDAILRYV